MDKERGGGEPDLPDLQDLVYDSGLEIYGGSGSVGPVGEDF
jgi:hypothetical protein